MRHTHDTVQCVACHATTNVAPHRVASTGLAEVWANLDGRFTAPFDLAPLGDHARTLRAFGYAHTTPLISVRVATETANVLAEIATTFP